MTSSPLVIDPDQVRAFQQFLDPDARPLEAGEPLPPLWHWVALPRWPSPDTTGPDGHPRRTGALAAVKATRRMFAGGEVRFHRCPLLGEEVIVETTVEDVRTKDGRSGRFVLATASTHIRDVFGGHLVEERQDIVYVEASESTAEDVVHSLPLVGRPLVRIADCLELRTDPTILMRFSALTKNSHRIHYDLPYAREVEGLPGLLVHGPLLTLAAAHVAEEAVAGRTIVGLTHRNSAPVFCGNPVRFDLTSTVDGDVSVIVRGAERPDGIVHGRVVLAVQSPSTSN